MEGTAGPQKKTYLSSFTFAHDEGLTIEQAMEQAREVISCGENQDMTVIDGRTWRPQDLTAAEEFNYGSETVWRNERARAEERGEVAPLAGVQGIAQPGGVPQV